MGSVPLLGLLGLDDEARCLGVRDAASRREGDADCDIELALLEQVLRRRRRLDLDLETVLRPPCS
jgi:hypothetical protein